MTDRMPVACTGSFTFGRNTWKCWDKRGHGSLDLYGAIARSCDVYFYQLGQRIGMDRLVAGAVELGFASRTGVDLPSERVPDFPHGDLKAYYDRKIGPGRWSLPAEVLNLSIGQGANSQTILNMARFYSALANGGVAPEPHFVQGELDTTRVFNLDPAIMREVQNAMVGVLTAGGTAAASALRGVAVAGKTGTAQSGIYVEGIEQDHAWFVGFAPAENPRIVVAVMLELGGHGTRAAAITTKIMEHYLRLSLKPVEVTGQ
jgi:penicillin-binding protein 2